MTNLLVFKEQLTGFFSRFETYIVAVLKFFVGLIALLIVNSNLGYMSKIDNGAIVLIVSLLCSFLDFLSAFSASPSLFLVLLLFTFW